MVSKQRRTVALVSGGMDSAVAAALAREEGDAVYALSFDYGQRHRVELEAAARVAAWAGAAEHRVVRIELERTAGSALTSDLAVPKDGLGPGIPVTYVPARNLVFLSVAAGWAETLGARRIAAGVNAIDYSGYPDCRPEFLEAFQKALDLGTKAGALGSGPRIWAPLVAMSKADIVRAGRRLGLDFAITHSCYDPGPGGAPCGRCDACRLRDKGFAEAGGAVPGRT